MWRIPEWHNALSQEERDKQVKNAILDLLGSNNSKSKPFGVGSLSSK
jgi:hypothetical protein